MGPAKIKIAVEWPALAMVEEIRPFGKRAALGLSRPLSFDFLAMSVLSSVRSGQEAALKMTKRRYAVVLDAQPTKSLG